MNTLPDTIAPTDEQKTFEMLQMGKEEFDELSYIRRQMRYIVTEENKYATRPQSREEQGAGA
jgi:hypothetical protein